MPVPRRNAGHHYVDDAMDMFQAMVAMKLRRVASASDWAKFQHPTQVDKYFYVGPAGELRVGISMHDSYLVSAEGRESVILYAKRNPKSLDQVLKEQRDARKT